jgi:hypothetical protein
MSGPEPTPFDLIGGDAGVPDDLATRLMPPFAETADWMRNRPG